MKIKKLTKLTAFFLTLFMLSGSLSGCRSAFKSSETENQSVSGSESAAETDGRSDSVDIQPNRPLESIDYSGYGLQVDENGVIMLHGKPFYGMGVNFFPAAIILIGTPDADIDIYFQTLADAGIPYCRICFNIFYSHDLALYVEESTHDRYMKSLDKVVALAEKYNIGIIASLFWNATNFVEYCGETMDEMFVPDSKGMMLQKQYIKDVVGRYKYSPAIWAWEIGNELNLAVDIFNTKYIGSDGETKLFSTDQLTTYYRLVGEAIREEDPYRMITGGDSAPRSSSMSLYKSQGSSWSPTNTYDDYKAAFEAYTPAPLNTISVHYPELTWISEFAKMAKELKIGLYVGEFYGDHLFENHLDALSPEENAEEAAEQASWMEHVQAFIDNDVQLATAWCYASYLENKRDFMSIEVGMIDGIYQNVYQYEGLRDVNARYVAEGKSAAPAYWKSVSPLF